MLEFVGQSSLTRITLDIITDSEGGPAIHLKRWCRANMTDDWDEDAQEMTVWPDDPIRHVCDALVPIWSAQAKSEGFPWT